MCLLQLSGYPKRDDEKPCHTEWMYRLIWVLSGHTGLIVGFVERWLICFLLLVWGTIDTLWTFPPFRTKETTFMTSCLLFPYTKSLKMDLSYKEINAPTQSKFFAYRVDFFLTECKQMLSWQNRLLFRTWLLCTEANRKLQKVSVLTKMVKNLASVSSSFNPL